MKTAISLPDSVFEQADRLAAQLGLSRSELYARAVAKYVARHLHASVREQLDAVYGEAPSKLDRVLARMQSASLGREDW
jgi:metal-responsive CopG/Arc/MetJ family transcriptional regulator